MFLRRAFVGGKHLTARLSLPSHLSLHHYEQPSIPQLARGYKKRWSPHKHKSVLRHTHRLAEEVKRFRSTVFEDKDKRPSPEAILRFRDCITSLPKNSRLLDELARRHLDYLFLHLSKLDSHEDRLVLRSLLDLMAEFFRMGVDTYTADVYDQFLIRRDETAAFQWLFMSTGMEGIGYASSLPPWNQLLNLAAVRRNEYLIVGAFKAMDRLEIEPTKETGKIVVAGFFRDPSPDTSRPPPTYSQIAHVIAVLASTGLSYDHETAQVIVDEYARAGNEDLGKQVELLYSSKLSKRDDPVLHTQMNEELARLASEGNRKQQLYNLRQYKKMGLRPSDDTLIAVLGDDTTPDDYAYWRRTLRIGSSPRGAARVMEILLEAGGLSARKALEFYESEFASENDISPEMLHFAITKHLSGSLTRPSEREIDAAMKLYRDYVARCIVEEDPHDGLAKGPTQGRPRPRMLESPLGRTYQLLFRTFTRGHAAKLMPVVLTLVEDMQRFRVRLDPQSAASILIILMRSSPDPTEAFRMYCLFGRPSDKGSEPILNEEGYVAILNTFCKLETWPHGIPSTKPFFEIVSDMRSHGLGLNAKAYTIILGHLATLATSATTVDDGGMLRERVARTIARVHNHITVNSAFTPDTALWNQLMDAYQRAGCFSEAVRIWQNLFASGQFNHASVSIVVDACAFNRAYDVAVRIYTTLIKIGYPMNVRNWNTFLECLCRLNRMDEAMKVLCLEMTGRDDGVEPDKESVRILLKFAAKHNQEGEVRSKIKRFLPKLYYPLVEEIQGR